MDPAQVDAFFARTSPDYVFLAAGSSGGIGANQRYPAELIRDNLLIECNVIHSAYRHRVKKLIYLASSCCYPKHCPQPMREDMLLTGPLEPTNEAYAVAKIAGIKLCQSYNLQYGADFVSLIPANSYGPGDDFNPADSHVIAGLMSKMHHAKAAGLESVEIWGSGQPRREFIYVDDLANACLFVMQRYSGSSPINAGYGRDISIYDLARLIQEVIGFEGQLSFEPTKPDGMPVKLLDSSVLRELGWQPSISLEQGLKTTYKWYLENELSGS